MDFLDIFGQLDDPRIERKKLQPMPEILLLTLCAVICGSDSWGDIETFGKSKLNFLRRYLPCEHGIPSDDTLRRFFRAIDTAQFQRLFIEWVRVWLNPEVTNKVVAIDVRLHFEQPAPTTLARMARAETVDKGHGRVEVRQCRLSTNINWLRERHPEWRNLNSIIAIDSECHAGDTVTRETRYFIGSSLTSATQMLAAVCLHWGIENQLHVALNMIRQTKVKRMSIKRMRKAAGWDDSVLTEILAQVC